MHPQYLSFFIYVTGGPWTSWSFCGTSQSSHIPKGGICTECILKLSPSRDFLVIYVAVAEEIYRKHPSQVCTASGRMCNYFSRTVVFNLLRLKTPHNGLKTLPDRLKAPLGKCQLLSFTEFFTTET